LLIAGVRSRAYSDDFITFVRAFARTVRSLADAPASSAAVSPARRRRLVRSSWRLHFASPSDRSAFWIAASSASQFPPWSTRHTTQNPQVQYDQSTPPTPPRFGPGPNHPPRYVRLLATHAATVRHGAPREQTPVRLPRCWVHSGGRLVPDRRRAPRMAVGQIRSGAVRACGRRSWRSTPDRVGAVHTATGRSPRRAAGQRGRGPGRPAC